MVVGNGDDNAAGPDTADVSNSKENDDLTIGSDKKKSLVKAGQSFVHQ